MDQPLLAVLFLSRLHALLTLTSIMNRCCARQLTECKYKHDGDSERYRSAYFFHHANFSR
jgi:hypothetical protein